MTIEEKVATAFDRLNVAIKLVKPLEVFGLFSGGHDSLSACLVASMHPYFSGVVHINTGIGIEFTREFVRDTCKEKGWKLFEYKAVENTNAKGIPDPQIYDDLVLEFGFPGPPHHRKMYNRLKERQIVRLERDCFATRKTPVLYVSGCRSEESTRRMGHVEELQEDGRRVWCAPLHDWSKEDTNELISWSKSKRNLVVDLVHKSGECLCGAFAEPGELEEYDLWDITRPAYNRLIELQNRVMQKFPWGWGSRPPKAYLEEKRGQQFMEPMKQMLCWKCIHKP